MNCPCECHGRKAPALAVDAVLRVDGKILLIRRGNPPFQGYWALPGGFVECGETVEEAVIREIKEETNLEMVIEGILGVYSEPDRDPRGHVVSIVFMGSAEGEPSAGDDARESKLFDIDEVKKLRLAFDHRRIFGDYLKRVGLW